MRFFFSVVLIWNKAVSKETRKRMKLHMISGKERQPNFKQMANYATRTMISYKLWS